MGMSRAFAKVNIIAITFNTAVIMLVFMTVCV